VSETDPFSDAAFVGRLQKLLPMLGSQQPGEADAARRKLIDHLGQHRLSLLDVAARLREPPRPPAASFSQGARELSLERQLSIARQAKEEASHEALIAGMRIRALEAEMQHVTFEIARVLQSQVRVRLLAIAGWAATGIAVLIGVGPSLLHLRQTSGRPQLAALLSTPAGLPRGGDDSGLALRLGPNELLGTAAVQDLAIQVTPGEGASVRAFLNRGEPIAIEEGSGNRVRFGAQTWLRVRTQSNFTGWARSGDVMQP
jgi:hypothetical protein